MMTDVITRPATAKSPQRSLTDHAYERIQHMIVVGDLRPYELISEVDLARELGCGRTPVREALQRLKFEGFIEILPRRGALVAPIDVRRQLDLLETRRPLEEQMIRLAARRATPKQRDQMLACAEGLSRLLVESRGERGSYKEAFEAIKAAHQIEAEATQNGFLRRQMAVIHNLSLWFWFSHISDSGRFADGAHLHANTLRAAASGDVEAAVTSCRELLDFLEVAARTAVER